MEPILYEIRCSAGSQCRISSMYLETWPNLGMPPIRRAAEFGNIQAWAMRNNHQINANKTKEMIIFRRRSKSVTYPPEPLIPGAERVTALRVLGVVLSSRLTMGDHLDQLLSSCASSIFALRTLKSHGLRP